MDFLSTLMSTCVGAGFAFFLTAYYQKAVKNEVDLVAGTGAIFNISAQFRAFANYRLFIYQTLSQFHAMDEEKPEWLYAMPVSFTLMPYRFDFKSLGFLLSTPDGRVAFEKLMFLESIYFDLLDRIAELNESSKERQIRTVELMQKSLNPTEAHLEFHLGPELIERLKSQQKSVLLRISQDDSRYLEAANLISSVLTAKFGKKYQEMRLVIDDKYALNNLPKLPPVFQGYLDAQQSQS